MLRSLERTKSPARSFVLIMSKPILAEPNKAIQITLRTPIKGFFDSLSNRSLKAGSKLDCFSEDSLNEAKATKSNVRFLPYAGVAQW